MPLFSDDGSDYCERVYSNGRLEDQNFEPDELLYRRIREQDLVNGRPQAAALQFRPPGGHSVNRSKFSQPQDVLEPDCCGGNYRSGYVVLTLAAKDLPDTIYDEASGRGYRFRAKHVPMELCYPHSEIWCNQTGSVNDQYEEPSKEVKNKFRGELVRALMKYEARKFEVRTESA